MRPVPTPSPTPVDPEVLEVGRHLRAGLTALDAGDPARAAEHFADEAAFAPLREDALFWRAVALQRAGSAGALEAWSAFLGAYPNAPRAGEAHCVYARGLRDAGRTEEARAHFEAASRATSARARRCGDEGLP
jgi:tetratricopeptide (TPR) repeat protein